MLAGSIVDPDSRFGACIRIWVFCSDPDPHQSDANLLDWPPQIPAFHFDMDQNPAFHFEADPDPAFPFGTDPACYFDADPDPQPLLAVC